MSAIVVQLPEGPTCEAEAGDGTVSCILPQQNAANWHEVFSGHLGQLQGEWVSWNDPDEVVVREDITASEEG